MDFTLVLSLVLFGLAGGFLSGLVGVGGGIIFVPVFDFIFRSQGIEGEELVRLILANSFLAILFAGILSSYQQYKKGHFHAKLILLIVVPAMIVGGFCSRLIAAYDWYGNAEFKLLFIGLLAFTLWRSIRKKSKSNTDDAENIPKWKYSLIGLITGTVSAFSGLGGGVAMIPLLRTVAHKEMRTASAISIGVIPIMVLPFLGAYAMSNNQIHLDGIHIGYLQLSYALPLIIGIFIGAPFGVRIAHKIENHHLQFIFATLLTILIVKYLVEVIG